MDENIYPLFNTQIPPYPPSQCSNNHPPYSPLTQNINPEPELKFPSVRPICGRIDISQARFLRSALETAGSEYQKGVLKLLLGGLAANDRKLAEATDRIIQHQELEISALKEDLKASFQDICRRQLRSNFVMGLFLPCWFYFGG